MARVTKTITATKAPTVSRRDVKAGTVFASIVDGKPGKELYGALGHNGKYFSIHLSNGELSSSKQGDKKVVEKGSFTFNVNLKPENQWVEKTRNKVAGNEVFKVKGRDMDDRKSYLHLGKLADGRFTSIDLSKPFGEDYAVTDEAHKNVVVVGTYDLNATVAQ